MTHFTEIRTRFAPSPTGSLHIGGLRTALFNWMFARHHGGKFYLRIEDTDQTRLDPHALENLLSSLKWAGIDWDEGPDIGGSYGPYVQSQRLEFYQSFALQLIDLGLAYYSFETPEELAEIGKNNNGYDRSGRWKYPDAEDRIVNGESHVVRFKANTEGTTIVRDRIIGEVEFDNDKVPDAVLLKSDGFPTYHLAHVEDDFRMGTSHVLRAAEWLPSTPLHLQLWDAMGVEPPIYAHLPVLLNPNGKGKMSKRNPPKDAQGNIIPVMVEDYAEAGYLPEAMLNFLANVGWNFGDDRELFSIEEAIWKFDLSEVSNVNSAFPYEKLKWLNGQYIENMQPYELTGTAIDYLKDHGIEIRIEKAYKLMEVLRTRIKKLEDIFEMANFCLIDNEDFEPAESNQIIQKKMTSMQANDVIWETGRLISPILEGLFTAQLLHDTIQPITEAFNLSNGQVFGVLRVAVTGQTVSPPTFDCMELIGKRETLRRLGIASDVISRSMDD